MPRARNHTSLVRDDAEPLLASQLLPPNPPKTGARGLMAAMLEQAMDDLRAVARASAGAPTRWPDARTWIEADDEAWPFSFVNVCDALDLEADAIRSALARGGWRPGRVVSPGIRRHPLAVTAGGQAGTPPTPLSPRWQPGASA